MYIKHGLETNRFLVEKDSLGRIIKENVSHANDKNLWKRRNYSNSDNINFLDGDYDSRLSNNWGKDDNINEFGETKENIVTIKLL